MEKNKILRPLALAGIVVLFAFAAVFTLRVRPSLANDPAGPPNIPQVAPASSGAQALSPQLSYYFVAGSTFTTHGGIAYTRQVTGCVNQMPIGIDFTAPVHLPQGSRVVSITAYTWNSASDAATSKATFILNDGAGAGGWTVSAQSAPNTSGYQKITSTENNPVNIDNQNYSYWVSWRKEHGATDSPLLSLCGVRVAYYAPLFGTQYVPYITQ